MQTSRVASRLATALLGFLALAAPANGQGTTRISVDSSGIEGNSYSASPKCDGDGNLVAFVSNASNLVPKDQNHTFDIFLHDLATGVTERVSVNSSNVEGNGESDFPAINPDGRFVAFASLASNLVSGDTNVHWDVFVRDRSAGTTERVSVDSSGGQVHLGSWNPSISADGRFVAFSSYASMLVSGDNNGANDIFVHDRTTGITERVSVDSSGAEGDGGSDVPSISDDGSRVAFQSDASNLVAGDTNGALDVFVRDRSTGITERVSVDSSGAEGTDRSEEPSMSSDGNLVAFTSAAPNLMYGDTDRAYDIFVRDRSAATTRRVSLSTEGAQPNDDCGEASISADGRVVSYDGTASNLVDDDRNATLDVFLHEPCEIDASWNNYGAGFPGTNGVPAFTARTNPVLGLPITLDLACSSGGYGVGMVLIGTQRTDIPTTRGGDLLVVPLITVLVALAPTGALVRGDLSPADSLCGAVVELQALEIDPGAAQGYSFTPGLELVLGR